MTRYFLCDFETTGLLKEGNPDFLAQPGIVQIGAILLNEKFEEVDALSSFINPEIAKWEDGAMKTHGIKPDDVQGANTFFAAFPKMAQMATGATHWVGYNSHFDKKVLWHQLARYGFEMNFPWPLEDIDVMKLASNRMALEGRRGTKNPKLVDIYEFLFPGQSFEAHDALEDIRATARVFKELSK